MQKPQKGAGVLLHFVSGRVGIDWTSGSYYHLTKQPKPKQEQAQTKDLNLEKQIWDRSAQLVGTTS
ncbi:hypothetical protein IWX65_003361 [Arthrobacter sp. CAN_A214]|uniref:hypothetical protein n=1 Tax=Arthrobacter sp. CAN_A214 TaxID=2787720 RepID=UPI0018CB9087